MTDSATYDRWVPDAVVEGHRRLVVTVGGPLDPAAAGSGLRDRKDLAQQPRTDTNSAIASAHVELLQVQRMGGACGRPRERVGGGRTSRRSGSPKVASLVQSLIGLVVILTYAVAGWDPLCSCSSGSAPPAGSGYCC